MVILVQIFSPGFAAQVSSSLMPSKVWKNRILSCTAQGARSQQQLHMDAWQERMQHNTTARALGSNTRSSGCPCRAQHAGHSMHSTAYRETRKQESIQIHWGMPCTIGLSRLSSSSSSSSKTNTNNRMGDLQQQQQQQQHG